MNWVVWRVQRTQYVAAAGLIAALALWMLASGLAASSNWAQITNHGFEVLLYGLPCILGLALGSPLVASEVQHGTNRLAWSQSVTRARWLSHKLFVGAIVSLVLVTALAPLVRWWTGVRWVSPHGLLTRPTPYVYPQVFGITGIVGIGYVLFAFCLGALLGAVVRRSGWAFAIGVPIVIAVRLLVDGLWPTLVAPVTVVNPPSPLFAQQNGYELNQAYLPIGQTTPPPGQTWRGVISGQGPWKLLRSCSGSLQGEGPSLIARENKCAAVAHLQLVVQYQPESHYWALQGVETGILLAIALAVLAATFLVIRWWRA